MLRDPSSPSHTDIAGAGRVDEVLQPIVTDSTTYSSLWPSLGAGVVVVAVLKDVLFFSLAGLVGFQYTGSGDSVAWMVFVAISFTATVFAFILACGRRPSLTRIEVGIYGFMGFMLLNHLLWWTSEPSTATIAPTPLVHFIAFSLPGVMAIRIAHAFNAWTSIIRLAHVAAVAMAMGIIASVLLPFAFGRGEVIVATGLSTLGGATAQSASYFAAFVFGLLGFYLFRAEPWMCAALFVGRVMRAIQLSLWLAMAFATVLNGGRGGLLLLLGYFAANLYWFSIGKQVTYRSLVRIGVVALAVPILSFILYGWLESSDIFGVGFKRALDVFFFLRADESISLAEASSYRDTVYQIAIDGIRRAPLLGYGAFAHWDTVIQPHNFLLDLALQFGVPLACLITLYVGWALFCHLRQPGAERSFFFVLAAYPVLVVSFSSGYFLQPLLWLSAAGLTFRWCAPPPQGPRSA